MISGIPFFDFQYDLEGQKPAHRSWLRKLLGEDDYRLRRYWYSCWRIFGTISRTPSFGLEFNLKDQMQGQRSWFCELPREATCRLWSFWCKCWRSFGTISSTQPFEFQFDLEGQMSGQRSSLRKLSREASHSFKIILVRVATDVNPGRYSASRALTLNLTLKVKARSEVIGVTAAQRD